jgi:hypothetical protein
MATTGSIDAIKERGEIEQLGAVLKKVLVDNFVRT